MIEAQLLKSELISLEAHSSAISGVLRKTPALLGNMFKLNKYTISSFLQHLTVVDRRDISVLASPNQEPFSAHLAFEDDFGDMGIAR